MIAPQTILHVDLDAFFAAVEQRDDPTLRGRPVLVGGSVERGVVAAASYEARAFGVHSAMPMAEALRRCPRAVVISHNFGRYAEASRGFFQVLDRYAPTVEPLSLDEAFLDVTGSERLLGDGPTIARSIKAEVLREQGLVASVGVAPSKFVAKIASDIRKPDGLCVVKPQDVLAFLHPLPVSRLWGVGKVTREKLAALGLSTIGQVAGYPEQILRSRLGSNTGAHLAALARAEDPRRVQAHDKAVSIGHEQTFDVDIADPDVIGVLLLGQSERVAARLRHGELRTRTVTIKIKFADFRQITRRRTLRDPTSDGAVIGRIAKELLSEVAIDDLHGKRRRVRLCGVSAGNLEPRQAPRQLTLHEAARERGEILGDTLDQIQEKFGDGTIKRAAVVARENR